MARKDYCRRQTRSTTPPFLLLNTVPMGKFLRFFRTNWRRLQRKLAFLPTSLSLFMAALGFLFLHLDERFLAEFMRENAPILVIGSADTARAILTTLISGVISLTVFSFSMVMIVLNQAANNLSPRLLPDLIAERSHQIVLGCYLGVIVFCLLALITILPDSGPADLPTFTLFSCVLLGIGCLALFVFFINSISQRVQIDHITHELHRDTVGRLRKHAYHQPEFHWQTPPDLHDWHGVPADRSGYLAQVDFATLSREARKLDTGVYINTYQGFYVLQGIPLFYVSRELTAAEATRLAQSLLISVETPSDWYLSGIKQLAEVGVRAMSPGINDPGTTLRCIDLLTELLAGCMRLPDRNVYRAKEGADVFFKNLSFEAILRQIMTELRQYSKSDPLVMQKLVQLLFFLKQQTAADSEAATATENELRALVADANQNLQNDQDRAEFTRIIDYAKQQLKVVQRGHLIKGEEERRKPGVALN
jgi:uncharacterized membrane protein